MSQPMNLLISLNQRYLFPLCTMLTSLQENNPGEKFRVYLVSNDLSQDQQTPIRRILEPSGSELIPIQAPQNLFRSLPVSERLPRSLYYRLFAALYLPEDLDRILFLDPDLVVLKPIRELYDLDLGDHLFAAATATPPGMERFTRLLPQDSLYFNRGVLLYNLEQLRQEQTLEKASLFLKKWQNLLFRTDADLFSRLYGDRVLPLDSLRYNLSEKIYNAHRRANPAREDFNPDWVKKNTVIFHYAGRNKPWNDHYLGQFDVFYLKYSRQAALVLGDGGRAILEDPTHPEFEGEGRLPLVSLIIPVYNSAASLPRLLDSILGQSYSQLEVFLINDGSTDNSLEVLEKYAAKDPRLQVITHPNGGPASCRNLGLSLARGEYIMFADSDDWLEPNAAERLVIAAETTGCELVIADYYRIIGDRCYQMGRIDQGLYSRKELAEIMMDNPADFYYGVVWNKFFRLDIIRANGLEFPRHLDWCEDFLFNLEYLQYAEQIYILKEPLYYYVKTKGSLSSMAATQGKIISTRLELFDHYKDLYQNLDLYQENKLKIHRFMIDFAREHGQRQKPNERLLKEEGLIVSQDED